MLKKFAYLNLWWSQTFFRRNMTKNIKEFDVLADQFAEVPMFFMTYFGQEEVEKVIEVKVICFSRLLKCLRSLYGK